MRKSRADYLHPQLNPTRVGGGLDPFRTPPAVALSVRLHSVHPSKDVIPPWTARNHPFIQSLINDKCANVFDAEGHFRGSITKSRLSHLYAELPDLMAPHIFADAATIDLRAPRWGDASGVRGAAWLWDGA